MARFIKIRNTIVNLDQVKKIERHWAEEPNSRWTKITFSDDTTGLFEGEYVKSQNCAGAIETITPANAGFELLTFWFYDEEPTFEKVVSDIKDPRSHDPIVAWRAVAGGRDHLGAA
jgi:hypothetical protein